MAEAAIALFASLGSAAATGATAAGSALASGAAAVGSGISSLASAGSTALSILQGGATAASVAASLVGGIGQYQQGQQNAQLAELQGNQEALASQQKALQIQRDLAQQIGATRVAFAGSGVDISSGSAVESNLRNEAAFQTDIEKNNADEQRQMAAMRAQQYRSGGFLDLLTSGFKAAATAGGYGLDIAKRG